MSDNKNITTIRRLYDEALNGGLYEEVVDDLTVDDVVMHEPDGDQHGPEAIKRTMRALHRGFSDLHFSIEDLIDAGDRIVIRWTMHGHHSAFFAGFDATNRDIEQRAIVIYRLENGRVAEVWPQIDRFGMMRQLGSGPAS